MGSNLNARWIYQMFTCVGSIAINSSLLHVGVAFESSGSWSRASNEKAPPVNPAVRSSIIIEIELPLCCLHIRTERHRDTCAWHAVPLAVGRVADAGLLELDTHPKVSCAPASAVLGSTVGLPSISMAHPGGSVAPACSIIEISPLAMAEDAYQHSLAVVRRQ